MGLEFYLATNNMTADSDDYMAISSNTNSYSIEDVFDHMTREGSTITKAEALASFEEISQGIINLIRQGNAVVTPLFNIRSGISGVFEDEDDNFDANRHQVRINLSVGSRLRPVAAEIDPQKIKARERQPDIEYFYDDATDTKNEVITPGRGARIAGELLKFDEDDPTQGIFFVNKDDSSETRVDESILKNKPGELIFIVPALPAGAYRLEVRSIIFNTTELRTGALSHELTVS